MKPSEADNSHLRILKIHFIHHKMPHGIQEFVFDRQRTLITGDNGTGKTTIMNVLASIDSDTEVKPCDDMGSHKVTVEVKTSGNREWMQRYREVIIINGVNSTFATGGESNAPYASAFDALADPKINNETRKFFGLILEKKPWNIDIYKNLNPDVMPIGEKMCFKYAYIFAIRHALNIELPVIIDSPYGLLDKELRDGFRDFLDRQICQQILLGTAAEFEGEKAQYHLSAV